MWPTSLQEADDHMEKNKYQINVLGTGIQFYCCEDEFILDAMKRSGLGPIHYGCFGGGCGICKMRILSGQYSAVKRMSRAHVTEQEQEDGLALVCCIKPRSNLTIAISPPVIAG